MRLAVIIPTIPGREQDLARATVAYERTAPEAEVYVETGHACCGAAWIAGAAKAIEDGPPDYLHFTADDLEPHDEWLETAIETADRGYVPAPLVFNPDGTLDSAGLAGFGQYRGPYSDWQYIGGTTVPFLTCEMWETIRDGVAPILERTHYTTDLAISHAARYHGWETVIRPGMAFTHYTASPGRNYERVPADTEQYVAWARAYATREKTT